MTDDLRITIALICGAVLFGVLFFYVFFKGSTNRNRVIAKAKRDGAITTGKAVRHDYLRFTGHDGMCRSEIIVYEYVVNWDRFQKKIMFTDNNTVRHHPNQVEIYYNKRNPAKAYADAELTQEQQKSRGYYVAVIVPIVAVILIYCALKFI